MLSIILQLSGVIKKHTNKLVVLASLLMINIISIAQQTAETTAGKEVQMADGLRSSGKIYVVVAVLLTVLIGLFIYLIRLDRKISKIEKK